MSATCASPTAASTSRHTSLSIAILAFSAFLIVTTEFLIVGLLPAIARDLHLSISATGQLVTLFAFTVMLLGPPLTAALSHLDRKKLFVTILCVFAAANGLAAMAENFTVLALARIVPAMALPVFWGTASETAGQLAGPEHAGRAVARVYLGISAAMLLGIPLGTVASTLIGWRGSFWLLAGLSLLMAIALWWLMPSVARTAKLDLRQQAKIFKDPYFVANVLLSVVVFTAMFVGYTYLADLLERVAGIPAAQVGWWLMGFGAVGLIGNWLGGKLVDRSPLNATRTFLVLLALGMAALVPAAQSTLLLCAVLALWGIANTALYPICQVRVMACVSQAKALAGTANVSAANAGIGLGAIIGAATISNLGTAYIGYVAAGVAVLALVSLPLVRRLAH
ncbi:MFS transporter [Pseudomonas sp. S75]|uniref:MFS transporter n=1 Tax=unclassified Pseudomonas TaxID=196821 RepID=UPI001906CB3D|nr:MULTISPECIES: MFS transporter [unclassified Pseudomonas]MBJ9975006.1 MFS transporter [Pseudomonas sp. S30]MBK0152843.1 MFS transporter [Pseudomonas sp. S75]